MNEIKIVIGDILTPPANDDKGVIVCHQVNCMGVMGAGLARQIRDRFPVVYQHYKDKCRLIKEKIGGLGDVQYCSVIADAGFIIANVFGQYRYGRENICYTSYDALRLAFTNVAMSFPTYTIRIPYKMGCGLAGGDWSIVQSIIRESLVNKGIDVEIWKLPGVE